MICAYALKLLIHAKDYVCKLPYRFDIVRDVISDYDPKTGEERIWHVYDKGQRATRKSDSDRRDDGRYVR